MWGRTSSIEARALSSRMSRAIRFWLYGRNRRREGAQRVRLENSSKVLINGMIGAKIAHCKDTSRFKLATLTAGEFLLEKWSKRGKGCNNYFMCVVKFSLGWKQWTKEDCWKFTQLFEAFTRIQFFLNLFLKGFEHILNTQNELPT